MTIEHLDQMIVEIPKAERVEDYVVTMSKKTFFDLFGLECGSNGYHYKGLLIYVVNDWFIFEDYAALQRKKDSIWAFDI